MTRKEKNNAPVNVKMKLIADGISVEKVCKTAWEVFTFYRDMPAKHKLLFSGKPYVIAEYNLDAMNN